MQKKFHNSYLAHFLLFNFFFLAYSLFSTLISVYMQDLGYSNAQVSLLVSSSFFASMLAQPIFGVLSDALGIKKIFLFSFLVMMVGAVFFMKATQLWQLLVWYSQWFPKSESCHKYKDFGPQEHPCLDLPR